MMRYGAEYGLWHPPLYLYGLSTSMLAFGKTTTAARIFGLIMGFISIFLIYRITLFVALKNAFNKNAAALAVFISCFFVAINPLWIHGTLRVDIDNTLLLCLTLYLLYVFLLYENQPTRFRLFQFAVIYWLLLWTKLTNPPMLLLGMMVYCGLRNRFILGLKILLAALISVAVFILSWLLYANLFDIPWQFFIAVLYRRSVESSWFSLYDMMNALRYSIIWMSLPFSALSILVVFMRLIDGIKKKLFMPCDLFLILAVILLIFYTVIWCYFNKYTVVLVPLLSIPISILMVKQIGTYAFTRRDAYICVLMLAVLLAYYIWVIPDILVSPLSQGRERTFRGILRDPRILKYILATVPLLMPFFFWFFKRQVIKALFLGFTIILIPANLVQSVSIQQVSRNTDLLWPSSEKGFIQIIEHLNQILTSEDTVILNVEFEYYLSRGKVIPTNLAEHAKGYLKEAVRQAGGEPTYIVLQRDTAGLPDELKAYLSEHLAGQFDLIKEIGSFAIWRNRNYKNV